MATIYSNFLTGSDATITPTNPLTPFKTNFAASNYASNLPAPPFEGGIVDGQNVQSTESFQPPNGIGPHSVSWKNISMSWSDVSIGDAPWFGADMWYFGTQKQIDNVTLVDTRVAGGPVAVFSSIKVYQAGDPTTVYVDALTITANAWTGVGFENSILNDEYVWPAASYSTLNIDAEGGGAYWSEVGCPLMSYDAGLIQGNQYAVVWDLAVASSITVNSMFLYANGNTTGGYGVVNLIGGYSGTLSLLGCNLICIGTTEVNPAVAVLNTAGNSRINVADTSISSDDPSSYADGFRFPLTGNGAHSHTVNFSGVTTVDIASSGTKTNALFRSTGQAVTVTGTLSRLNASILTVTSSGGTIDLSGFTATLASTDSVRGGKMPGVVNYTGTGTVDSTAAALDLSDSIVNVSANLTITKVGGNAVTDSVATKYYIGAGKTFTKTGWTSNAILGAGVATLVSFSGSTAVVAWSLGYSPVGPVTAQLQGSTDNGANWTNIAGQTTSPGTDSTSGVGRTYRVAYDDGVSTTVYSNTIYITAMGGMSFDQVRKLKARRLARELS